MLTQRMMRLAIPERAIRKPLDPSFNAAVWRMAYKFNPDGWDTADPAPVSLTELRHLHAITGRIVVGKDNSDFTIYDRPATNIAFRAWHDHAHITLALAGVYAEFDLQGETNVMHLQQSQLIEEYGKERAAFWCRILEAEIVGQIAYHEAFSTFPRDQYAVDLAYLETHP